MTSKKSICQRWVVKIGSQMVCAGGPRLINNLMHQVAFLRFDLGVEVVWVTSGAIATARDVKNFGPQKRSNKLSEKQALSAIGQPQVINRYNAALKRLNLEGAQVLLTYDDLASRVRRQNFISTIDQLLKWNVLPILNENDAVATEEIRFGDNDSLSARVACAVNADRLVILTDVEGLYDSDPRKNSNAKLIHSLPKFSPSILKATLKMASKKSGTSRGTGGMLSKILAAKVAQRQNIETWLVRGDLPKVLVKVAAGLEVGTRIGKQP